MVFRGVDDDVHLGFRSDDAAGELSQLTVESSSDPIGCESCFGADFESPVDDGQLRIPEPHGDGAFTQLLDQVSSQFRRVVVGLGHVCCGAVSRVLPSPCRFMNLTGFGSVHFRCRCDESTHRGMESDSGSMGVCSQRRVEVNIDS